MSELSEQKMQKFTDDLIDCEQKSIAYPNLTEIYPKGTVSHARFGGIRRRSATAIYVGPA